MLSATEFYNKYNGKGYDIDGVAGKQCVDLWKIFCTEYGVKWQAAGGSGATKGFACQYWITHRTKSWITDNFKVISGSSSLQDGDWCFWAYGSKGCAYSHVAMYYKGKFFGMNHTIYENGVGVVHKEATLVEIDKSGILGHFRPKCYITSSTSSSSTSTSGVKSPTKWNKSCANGVTFTVIPDVGLILRKGAGKSYGKIVTMPKGTKVKYYGGYGGKKPNWWIYVAVTVNGKSYEGWCKPNDGNTLYLKGYEI